MAAAVLAVLPAPAHAARPTFWATVNVCDSEKSPNAMGVRASMPGNGTRERMYMRFSAQYYSHESGGWEAVEGARSPWLRLGSARYRYRQGGWTFRVDPPAGGEFLLRGVVRYEWRRGRRVVKRRLRVTQRDVPGVDRGEGISRASCTIS